MSGSPSTRPEPEALEAASAQKRKASQSPGPEDDSSKRQRRASSRRTESDEHDSRAGREASPAPPKSREPVPSAEPDRRRSVTQEERKRGIRLFGGLMNTLSQAVPTSQQKKRQEIEQRQQERARQRRVEDDRKRAERLGRLTDIRRVEQIRFDEKVMRSRHSNMLALARSLRTRAEPGIYYRPYELTREQEDTIEDQVKAASATIEREVEEFSLRKEQHVKQHGRSRRPSTPRGETATATVAPADADSPARTTTPTTTAAAAAAAAVVASSRPTNDSSTDEASEAAVGPEKGLHDDGDEVVEADEDMVIY